ncbi:MAG: peptidoglycan bridge formation glycyltransferase FemA/FemB family protein [Patescibacteria group bacterium]
MIIRQITVEEKDAYNRVASHPVQSWQWGEFRESIGLKVFRLGAFEKDQMVSGAQIMFRPIPKTNWTAGQFLKGPLPDGQMVEAIKELGRQQKAIFIRVEPDFVVKDWPNIKGVIQTAEEKNYDGDLGKLGLVSSKRTMFDPHSFIMDLTLPEEEVLSQMHPKTRYNIRLAERKGVVVDQKNDEEGLETFLKLFNETKKRQKFYMHSDDYFRKMWQVLSPTGVMKIFLASYQGQVLTAWVVFVFGNRIFYPYGASSTEYRNLMASYLTCFRVIQFGKQQGCQAFDMWGSMGLEPDPKDPWYGFHRFKLPFGARLVEFGSWDLVLDPLLYPVFNGIDSARWAWLRLKKKLPF